MKAERQPAHEPAWVGDVLRFWFETLTPAAWFRRDAAVDAEIRRRFADLHARLAAADHIEPRNARTALATVIVLDQFPRNVFRGTPQAFASDAKARQMTKAAVAAGLDLHLDTDGRVFLYLPLEHSEAADDQRLSVALISALCDANYTKFALAHKVIIDRFGRFPHRNAILGRMSTPDEIAFLAEPGRSF